MLLVLVISVTSAEKSAKRDVCHFTIVPEYPPRVKTTEPPEEHIELPPERVPPVAAVLIVATTGVLPADEQDPSIIEA